MFLLIGGGTIFFHLTQKWLIVCLNRVCVLSAVWFLSQCRLDNHHIMVLKFDIYNTDVTVLNILLSHCYPNIHSLVNFHSFKGLLFKTPSASVRIVRNSLYVALIFLVHFLRHLFAEPINILNRPPLHGSLANLNLHYI